jgi:glycosyltransferase involved in cell wall biosynthesis
MTAPLVSVVVPTYNREEYLREALDSALAQTYPHIEVLVMDDGSSDGTQTRVEAYEDPRIRYHRNSTNLGQTRTNHLGFSIARGKYVANLHDDDRWDPRFLERLVPTLEADDSIAVAFCDHWLMDWRGMVNETWTDTSSRFFKRDRLAPGLHRPFYQLALLDLSIPVVMGSVMRRSVLDLNDFPDEVDPIYDLWLAYLLCRDGWAAYYLPDRLTYYRAHPAQEASHSTVKKTLAHLYCYRRFAEDGYITSLGDPFRDRLKEHHVHLAIDYLCSGNTKDARASLRAGLPSRPYRSIPAFLLSLLPSRVAQPLASAARNRTFRFGSARPLSSSR